jgi:hypothetical protein
MNVKSGVMIACAFLLSARVEGSVPEGTLGHPLGTYLTIEGARAETGKVGTKTLLVDTINGKRLDRPIGIWIDNVASLPKRERCIIKGYETGKMIGVPPAVIEAAREAARAVPPSQATWQFYRFFVMISPVRPEGLIERPEPMSYEAPLRRHGKNR